MTKVRLNKYSTGSFMVTSTEDHEVKHDRLPAVQGATFIYYSNKSYFKYYENIHERTCAFNIQFIATGESYEVHERLS